MVGMLSNIGQIAGLLSGGNQTGMLSWRPGAGVSGSLSNATMPMGAMAARRVGPKLPRPGAAPKRTGIGSLLHSLGQSLNDPVAMQFLDNAFTSGTENVDTFTGIPEAIGLKREMQFLDEEEKKETAQRRTGKSAATHFRTMGPDYEQFAIGVESGAMSPSEAWNGVFQQQQDERKRQQMGQLLPEGDWRDAFMGGGLEFNDAYKLSQSGDMAPPNVSMAPVWLQGPEGPALGQLTDQGTMVLTQTPEGYQPLGPYETAAARSAGGKYGQGAGQAAIDLPAVEAQTEFALNNLAGLIYETDDNGEVMIGGNGQPAPNRGMEEKFGTGWFGLPTGQTLPAIYGTEKANFETRLGQVNGQAFLQAVESLQGSGAVSEIEGTKATQAIIRAGTAQSKDEFVKAINEAMMIYRRGLENARYIAANGQPPDQQQPQAQPGPMQQGQPVVATNPQTGEQVTWNGQQWVPMQ